MSTYSVSIFAPGSKTNTRILHHHPLLIESKSMRFKPSAASEGDLSQTVLIINLTPNGQELLLKIINITNTE